MSLFRPSLFPLGVIGIASCSHADSLTFIAAEFNATVKDLFPPDSIYPLAKNCFVFEEDDGTANLNLGDHLPGLVIIPSMMGNKKENIETLLADLCSNILAEFSSVVRVVLPLFILASPHSEDKRRLGQYAGESARQRIFKRDIVPNYPIPCGFPPAACRRRTRTSVASFFV